MYYQKKRVGNDIRAVHVLIVERILGRSLRGEEQVHHWDENKKNNDNMNLVVCPTASYHALLHVRAKAMAECGNPNLRKCYICKGYDDPANMYHKKLNGNGGSYRHSKCHNESRRKKH